MRRAGVGSFLAGLLALVVSSGCGSHLHRHGDAMLSEAAQAEVEVLEFDEGFAAREALEAELLAEELAAALDQVAADRDVALMVVIDDLGGTGRATWARDLDSRLTSLSGVGADPDMAALGDRLVAAGDDLASFEDALRRLERERDTYLAQAVALDLPPRAAPMPLCPGADDPARAPALDEVWRGFAEACDDVSKALAGLSAATVGGTIHERAEALLRLHGLLGDRDRQGKALLGDYEAARARCRDAAPANRNKPKPKREPTAKQREDQATARAAAVAACLAPAIDASLLALDRLALGHDDAAVLQPFDLDSLGAGPGSPAHLRLVDEQLAAVERLLAYEAAGRVTGDRSDDPSDAGGEQAIEIGMALAVAQSVARVHIDAEAGRFSLPRSELLLVRELLAVDRDGAVEINQLARHRLDLLHLGLESLLRERLDLLAAESFLLEDSCRDLTITDALLPGADADAGAKLCASYLRGALIQYANSWSVGVAREREAEVRADALHEREMRVRSSMTLAVRGLWIAAAVAELNRYNATGLRPETLATLLTNVAGFAVVAAGVFR